MSFWNFFKKAPKDHFLSFNPMGSYWRVVTWNFDLQKVKERKWNVEVHGTKVQNIVWHRNNYERLSFFENNKLKNKYKFSEKSPVNQELMNLALHSTLKYSIEKNHEFMMSPVSGATTLDIQNESKSLLWIQTSFNTLLKALDNIEKDPSVIVTAACFSGKSPENGEDVLRVIAFNLDIFYYLREDKTLQIVVFNDKNLGHGKSASPVFQQIIKVTKPQFYDEITKLLHRLAQVGEIS